ncbi:hypothetical protein JCGZ_10505 [Jatropha curcas]|uniref:Uncharacterized protein n=1 Tax=Jatropha curcas TaxID=180498 RepID=A0A067KL93_JATCU|nr:hypothetical protein JCGZ_10505 [Jatropha curcas]
MDVPPYYYLLIHLDGAINIVVNVDTNEYYYLDLVNDIYEMFDIDSTFIDISFGEELLIEFDRGLMHMFEMFKETSQAELYVTINNMQPIVVEAHVPLDSSEVTIIECPNKRARGVSNEVNENEIQSKFVEPNVVESTNEPTNEVGGAIFSANGVRGTDFGSNGVGDTEFAAHEVRGSEIEGNDGGATEIGGCDVRGTEIGGNEAGVLLTV